jgi:ice-binding like protein
MLTLLRRTTRLAIAIPAAALLFAACSNSSTGPVIPSLGTTSTYGILAGSAISCVTGATVGGDIGLSPGGASSITGFPTPCTRTGATHAADAAAAAAQLDLTTAYNGLKGLACGTTISANLGGTTLAPGVYCSASGLDLTGALTLSGSGTYVFQAGSALTVNTSGSVVLANGAQAMNVFWQVGSSATLGNGSTMKGNVVALTSISLGTTANLVGRALARNGAVSLAGTNTITLP